MLIITEDEDKILNLITTGDLFCRVKGNGESICWKQAFTTFIYRCKLEVKSNVSKESTIFNRSIDQVRQRYKTIQKNKKRKLLEPQSSMLSFVVQQSGNT